MRAWFSDATDTAANASRKEHDATRGIEGDEHVAAAKPVSSVGLPNGWIQIFDDTYKRYVWVRLCQGV